jgi:hypothetical protein
MPIYPGEGSILASGAEQVDGSGVVQPISATALPLPTGASTDAALSIINANLTNGNNLVTVAPIPNSVYRNINLGIAGSIVKSSPGKLYGVHFVTSVAAARYFKLYDLATVPTSANIVKMTFMSGVLDQCMVWFPGGMSFTQGIGIRATTGVADNDNVAPAANTCLANIWYT